MPKLDVLALTARTAALLLAPDGVKFRQARPVAWRLTGPGGGVRAEGLADTAVLFLDRLDPGSAYRVATPFGEIGFETPPCTGLMDLGMFGASPHSRDNTDAFARAVAAVPEGGTLRVPPGRFVTRPVFLKPRMTLHLDPGAVIAAPGDRTGWPQLPARDGAGRVTGTWEGLPEASFAAPVTAIDCPGLKITGRGTIDAGGDRGDWWTWPKETRDGARRPRAVQIIHSDDVVLSGITIRNAPSWTLHPYRCRRLTAAALTIANPPDSPNTDGFNPESCDNVTITGVDFSVGDDCIAIKAGKRAPDQVDHLAPTRGVRIAHCRMRRGHGAVVIGSEMSGGISDVTVENCEFHGTDRGLRIKTRRGRGGHVRDIRLHGVEMDDVATPLAVNAFYFCDPDGRDDWVQDRAPAPVDATTPEICGISFERVTARGVSVAAAAILGLPEAPVRGVAMRDFRVSYAPAADPEPPLMALGVAPVSGAGLIEENADVEGAPEDMNETEEAIRC
ncbi:glycoside hydrolase family 28 protein [Rhodobacterales bacterium HKCCE2091]|nr:glycoside hydrolase family 28 protein [Rhodobacterales bacterium HKCCE2091]